MNEAMQKLVEAIQKASPIVWQVAYRQVWINAGENLLLLAVLLFGARFLWKFAQRLADDNAEEVGVFFTRAGAVVALCLCIPCFIEAADCLFNPTFQAIKIIRSLI